eukprot:357067-Prymnesium_polylepis.1
MRRAAATRACAACARPSSAARAAARAPSCAASWRSRRRPATRCGRPTQSSSSSRWPVSTPPRRPRWEP